MAAVGNNHPGPTRRRVLVLVALGFFLTCAAGDDRGWWAKFKDVFSQQEKEVPPVEEVWVEAEAFFNGRETWWGRRMGRTFGEDSRLHREGYWTQRKNYPRAKELYEQVADNYPFSKYAPLAELRIADCQYFMEKYVESSVLYEQFAKMHPRREEVPYALYQEGMSHYQLRLKPGRDQDQTLQAIVVFDELVARFPSDPQAAAAKAKSDECRQRLIKHEFLIADFYYQRHEYWAAAARYRGIYTLYPGLGSDDQAMYMEASCYEALDKQDRARQGYARVIEAFPQGSYAPKAAQRQAELDKRRPGP